MTNVRNFAQAQYITGAVGTGGLATLLSGAFTIAAVARRSDSSFNEFGPVLNLAAGANGSRGMFRYNDNTAPANSLNYIRGQFQSPGNGPAWTSSDNWCLVAMTKAVGTTTVRYHKYVYSSATWSRITTAGTVENDGTACNLWNTRYQSDNDWVYRGRLAVMAAWNSALSDAALDQLVGTYADWVASSPIALWRFDQGSTAEPVNDQTGNGADQTALVGSTVVDDADLTFTFDQPEPAQVTAAVPLLMTVSPAAAADHAAAAAVPLDLALAGTTSAPPVPPAEVSSTVPLVVDVAATARATHQVTTSIPLAASVAAVGSTMAEVQSSVQLGLAVSAGVVTQHAVSSSVPLMLSVTAAMEAPDTVSAPIPLSVALAPTVTADHRAQAAVPLAVALAATTSTDHMVTGVLALTLQLAATAQREDPHGRGTATMVAELVPSTTAVAPRVPTAGGVA